MIEKEVVFQSGIHRISGSLSIPSSKRQFPAVLLIAGSGQVDRNENHKRLSINTFREIADYLASSNIATLRYDKRGVGASEGNYWTTGFYDNADDAESALAFLKQQENVRKDCVFLLGHSEGAFIATKIAGSGVDTAGVLLLAGGAQSGEAEMKWQALQVAKGLKGINGWLIRTLHINVAKAQQKQLDKIKRSKKDYSRIQLFAKINTKWMREFLAYDPKLDISRITVPVLAITGSNDIQVDPDDLERMAELVHAPFESHLIPQMTHLLRVHEGEAGISTYKLQVTRPMEPRLLELIVEWVERHVSQL